ncbi:MAG: ABC transporter permease [Gordonia sp. (in: high G+C Gram-positive bacteria)]|uniref:ABC transporter permease n=1 Tax=Gordonia sp. (in: high G+C Gram-positive bacteria) TaxID=84139 RepID=UPI0039E4FEE7
MSEALSTVPVRKVAAVIAGIAIAIPLILLMFIGPASRGAPHDLPLGIAGPAPAVAQVEKALDERQPGAFDVQRYDTRADLERATADREVYGGLVVGPESATVIATGASPAVAGTLTQIGAQIAAQAAARQAPAAPGAAPAPAAAPTVIDVAPPSDSDPRGAGFGSVVMPLFMAGAALGIALTMLLRRAKWIAVAVPVAAAVVAATCVGAAMAVGVLSGGFWPQWFAMFAGIAAIGAVIAGLVSLVGMAGMGIAALLFMLIGMPLAGIAAPPEYLPGVWGHLGQWLPLGAGGTALRGAAFFADGRFLGAGTGMAFAALAMWIVIGYALLGASILKRRKLAGEVLGEPAAG